MIQVTDKQKAVAIDIILDAMREMRSVMHYYSQTTPNKCECAKAIAALASSLDTRPNFIFGDINNMKEDAE